MVVRNARRREIRYFLSDYLVRILVDKVKARRLQADGCFVKVPADGAVPVSVQQYYLNHPPVFQATESKPRRRKLWDLFRKKA